MLLRHLLDEGLPKTEIAARLGVSRRLIYHWIATGQLDQDLAALCAPRERRAAPTKLDPYKAIIRERLATYPELSAARLFDEVRAAGYPGGVAQLQVFVRQVRPRPPAEEVVRFETPPGHQAQVDFATFRFPWGKRYVFLFVLGYSRLLWLQFYPRQTMATVCEALEGAFAYVGGVPREVLFDQMRAVIVDDARPIGGRVLENPEFLRFATHWGFRVRACRPYRARTKGKVERPVRYLRDNFVYGREFLGDGDLNAQALLWMDGTANPRVHGTTHEAPRERFERDERAALQSLPAGGYTPLVLPPHRLTRPTAGSAGARPPAVEVERRPLATYTQLAQLAGAEADA
ncbi:MAG TPA: IS21 family transposase [Vicinamibacterales bacterium]|nr:IS21 family transposase [Vicinamibacterales bacterium]